MTLPTFSWNTTILEVVGAELAVNALDTIVVEAVAGDCPVPVNNTKPFSPGT